MDRVFVKHFCVISSLFIFLEETIFTLNESIYYVITFGIGRMICFWINKEVAILILLEKTLLFSCVLKRIMMVQNLLVTQLQQST